LTIRDNGIGFDTQQPGKGLGLSSMQEHILSAGGRLTVESQPGEGATIRAEINLTRPHERIKPEMDTIPPALAIEDWPWLGQRLVIPVGQTWPWLPADQLHLRRPIIEPGDGPVEIQSRPRWLGLRKCYRVILTGQEKEWIRVNCKLRGYTWKVNGANWILRFFGNTNNQMVLIRNRQPLAAMQYRGRHMHTWSEIVYDGRAYRLSLQKDDTGNQIFVDHDGEELLEIISLPAPYIQVMRPLPLQLILMG
jgi:hypothetical protein